MSQLLGRFVPRAPRYILRPNDERFIRFAHYNNHSRTYKTELLNISETGLAFTTDRDNSPHIGDVIKVEFPIPGGNEHIAWFAQVIRIQEHIPKGWKQKNSQNIHHVLVGVRFHDLPPGHKNLIKKGLNHKFNTLLKDKYQKSLSEFAHSFVVHFWKGVFYLSLLTGTVILLYYFSRPDPHYDVDRGAPWGQRYPALNFFDPKDSRPSSSP